MVYINRVSLLHPQFSSTHTILYGIYTDDFCIVLKSERYFQPTKITIKNNYTHFISVYCGTSDHLQQLQSISGSKLTNQQKYHSYRHIADTMSCYIESCNLYYTEQLDPNKCTKVRQFKSFNKYLSHNKSNQCILIVCHKNMKFMSQSIGLQWIQVYGYEYSDDTIHNNNQGSVNHDVNNKRKSIDTSKLLAEHTINNNKRSKLNEFKLSYQNPVTLKLIADIMGS